MVSDFLRQVAGIAAKAQEGHYPIDSRLQACTSRYLVGLSHWHNACSDPDAGSVWRNPEWEVCWPGRSPRVSESQRSDLAASDFSLDVRLSRTHKRNSNRSSIVFATLVQQDPFRFCPAVSGICCHVDPPRASNYWKFLVVFVVVPLFAANTRKLTQTTESN